MSAITNSITSNLPLLSSISYPNVLSFVMLLPFLCSMNGSVGSSPELKRSAAADDDPGKSSAQGSGSMKVEVGWREKLLEPDAEVIELVRDVLILFSCAGELGVRRGARVS
ncbi:hypothetical protein Droror1_Dr00008365 [Drosera rotundifolia]